MFKRVLSAGVLLMACFVLAACGGGDSTGTGAADTTSAGSTEAGGSGETTTDAQGETGSAEGAEADSSAESEDGSSGDGAEGGAASAPTVSGPTLKKADYVKKGDAICEKVPQGYQQLFPKVNADLGEEEKKQKKKLSKKQKEEQVNLKAAVPPLRTAIEEFAALGAPAGDEELAQEVVDSLQAAADGLEADPSSPLTGKGSPFEEFVKVTKGYGFKYCPEL